MTDLHELRDLVSNPDGTFAKEKWVLLLMRHQRFISGRIPWDVEHGRLLRDLSVLVADFLMEHWDWSRARNYLCKLHRYLCREVEAGRSRKGIAICWRSAAYPIVAVALWYEIEKTTLQALFPDSLLVDDRLFEARRVCRLRPARVTALPVQVPLDTTAPPKALPICLAHAVVPELMRQFEAEHLPYLRRLLMQQGALDRRRQRHSTLVVFVQYLTRRARRVDDAGLERSLIASITTTLEEAAVHVRTTAQKQALACLVLEVERWRVDA